MRRLLTIVAGFTFLAASWFAVMYLVLRHDGYQWRFAIALLLVAQSILTIYAVTRAAPPAVRATLIAGALGIAWLGVSAIWQNNSPTNHDWEGYVDVMGAALVVQAVLTLWIWGSDAVKQLSRS